MDPSFLSSIQDFGKEKLKPASTIEKNIPVVHGKPNPLGVFNAKEIEEFYDSPEKLRENVVEFAKLIRESKHFVVYTGAGISTAAKIPDYRGPNGIWTLQAQGKALEKVEVTLEQALPTFSHMALVELLKRQLLHFVISTNVDGLHRRSGIGEKHLVELHGNIYREICSICGKEYLRPFSVVKAAVNRMTGRLCERSGCPGPLRDSIINFGENLPQSELDRAAEESWSADLTLVIGSSMRVQPACHLPSKSYQRGGKFVICNLQKTSFDKFTKIRVFAKCDEFMKMVMEELGIPVPEYELHEVEVNAQLSEMIIDPNHHTYSRYAAIAASFDAPPPPVVLAKIRNFDISNLRPVENKPN